MRSSRSPSSLCRRRCSGRARARTMRGSFAIAATTRGLFVSPQLTKIFSNKAWLMKRRTLGEPRRYISQRFADTAEHKPRSAQRIVARLRRLALKLVSTRAETVHSYGPLFLRSSGRTRATCGHQRPALASRLLTHSRG